MSIQEKHGIKSPLPKITDPLTNNDKATFLKKINAMRNLKQDKMNLINSMKMRSNVIQDASRNIRTRNNYESSTIDPNMNS